MPGIKRHHQESENSSKGEYIFGHAWGCVSLLIGNQAKRFSLPLLLQLQDGWYEVFKWEGSDESDIPVPPESIIVKMISQAEFAARKLVGDTVIVLDRAFLSVPVLKRLAEANLVVRVFQHYLS